MSTDTTATPPAGGNSATPGSTPTGGDGFAPITSQADLDRIIGERVARERAKFADYNDLKARATSADTRVSEVETALAAARAEAEAVPTKVTEALRTHLVGLHKIGEDDAKLMLTGQDPETLLAQVQRLTAGSAGPLVPGEGTPPPPAPVDPRREFLRSLMGEAGAQPA